MLDIKQIESFYPGYLKSFKRNLLREYIQYKILEAIFNSEFGNSLAFMGGTAIHIIYGNTRFSEDLDFDNLALNIKDFKKLSELVKNRLKREGYLVEVKTAFKGAFIAYIRISKILYDNKLTNHEEEVLLVKIDAEPQKIKYKPDKNIINKFDVFLRINVVPIDILLSQKIYAIFKRKRPIGRDFYDALFLLAKTKVNMNYLKIKLKIKDGMELKERILQKCDNLDFRQLAKDIEQFLFKPSDSQKVLYFCEYVEKLKF